MHTDAFTTKLIACIFIKFSGSYISNDGKKSLFIGKQGHGEG